MSTQMKWESSCMSIKGEEYTHLSTQSSSIYWKEEEKQNCMGKNKETFRERCGKRGIRNAWVIQYICVYYEIEWVKGKRRREDDKNCKYVYGISCVVKIFTEIPFGMLSSLISRSSLIMHSSLSPLYTLRLLPAHSYSWRLDT